ncbi:hypothetical protein C8Q77DRAFT_424888 [Trametes polyzona]|nr:hypothetical protein C8Q77DRAFT_424888 [Trametes polyzona]
MPRLIPRLLRAIDRVRTRPPRIPRTPPPPRTPLPKECTRAFTRPDEVDISPYGRTQSILLDRKTLRLIYRHSRYQRSKGLAPYIYVSESRWKAKQARGRAPQGALPRAMTKEERTFYANPYLRMLGSPLRQCFQTNWMLPRDLMIRMTPMVLPSEAPGRPKCTFLPSGLEHPAFSPFCGGRSGYLLCHKPVVDFVARKGTWQRFAPDGVQPTPMHSLVLEQIGHLLRVRVIQELHLLRRRLLHRSRAAKDDGPPLMRRLTRAEWADVKATGVVPFKNAIAILVVPPLNNDPETKTRPAPSMSPMPSISESTPMRPTNAMPISVMYPTTKEEDAQIAACDLPDTVPSSRVPLYNGVSLFPSRTQRAALHAALLEVLRLERTARHRIRVAPSGGDPPRSSSRGKGDQKASHAILVCSDESTLLRGDTVPLAIALWRVRMWEGETAEDCFVDWMAEPIQTA